MKHPTFGYVRTGDVIHAVHAHAIDHMPTGTAYQRFNRRAALLITKNVGTMTCAWVFCVLALMSLPAVLFAAGVIGKLGLITGTGFILVVSWLAQSFIQLVLLPAIMVGQNIQAEASDARAAKQFQDVEKLLDLMDTSTAGGLQEVMAKLSDMSARMRFHLGDGPPPGVEEGGHHLDG